MLAKDLLVLEKTGQQPSASLLVIPKNTEEPLDFLRGIVLDYVATADGVQSVLSTGHDFNWNDALNEIPNEFWLKYGVSFLNGNEVLLSGNVIEESVHADEMLLNENRHVVVKEFEKVSIVKLFANDEDGVYGDIYSQKWHVESEHQGEKIMEGFGILDKNTGYLLEDSKDWYWTLEEAEDDIPETEEEVIDLTLFSGKELFDLVFPEPEEPDFDKFETEDAYNQAFNKYLEEYDSYEELNSANGISEHSEVTEFEESDTYRDEWWEETTYQFKKGKHYFEIEEKSHVMTADSELLYNTFKILQ